jgi:DnaK suppressor protein
MIFFGPTTWNKLSKYSQLCEAHHHSLRETPQQYGKFLDFLGGMHLAQKVARTMNMDPIRTAKQIDNLTKRREQVAMSLRHVEKERNEAEENTDWLDRAAYDSRIALLDRLTEWYTREIDEIDRALARVKESKYGICLACHKPIETQRLEFFPEAEFCAACQETRESLQRV